MFMRLRRTIIELDRSRHERGVIALKHRHSRRSATIANSAESNSVYQLRVSLKYARPRIWRRVQVRGDITLAKLHGIVQVAMGSNDSHLHQFTIGRTSYGVRAAMFFLKSENYFIRALVNEFDGN